MTTSFIIHCLSWQAGRPKELDQGFVRVARHPGLGSVLSFTTRTCLRAARDSTSINVVTDRSHQFLPRRACEHHPWSSLSIFIKSLT